MHSILIKIELLRCLFFSLVRKKTVFLKFKRFSGPWNFFQWKSCFPINRLFLKVDRLKMHFWNNSKQSTEHVLKWYKTNVEVWEYFTLFSIILLFIENCVTMINYSAFCNKNKKRLNAIHHEMCKKTVRILTQYALISN